MTRLSGAQTLEQGSRQIAFRKGRNDDDDVLALVLRTLSDLDRGRKGRARRDAYRNAFEPGNEAGVLKGLVIGHGDDFVIDLGVEDLGRKSGADPWNLVRPGSAARQY